MKPRLSMKLLWKLSHEFLTRNKGQAVEKALVLSEFFAFVESEMKKQPQEN